MIYILKSDNVRNIEPEISNMRGVTIQMKIGWFIFDTENTKQNYYGNTDYITIDSEKFKIRENLIFKNIKKAELIFSKLKLAEMDTNGMHYFTPSQYIFLQNNLKNIIEEFPEHAI